MNSILLVSALLCATASAVADDSYFPIKTKTGGEGVTEFESKWYGQSLERMKEPRLPEFAKDANAEVYRITILPTRGGGGIPLQSGSKNMGNYTTCRLAD